MQKLRDLESSIEFAEALSQSIGAQNQRFWDEASQIIILTLLWFGLYLLFSLVLHQAEPEPNRPENNLNHAERKFSQPDVELIQRVIESNQRAIESKSKAESDVNMKFAVWVWIVGTALLVARLLLVWRDQPSTKSDQKRLADMMSNATSLQKEIKSLPPNPDRSVTQLEILEQRLQRISMSSKNLSQNVKAG